MEREEALEHYLARLRRDAGLSVEQVCERTKIQERYVRALEEGRYGELPSNTHLRAFSLAIAQACLGDTERAALLVRRALSPTGLADGEQAPAPSAPLSAPIAVSAPKPALVTPAPAAETPRRPAPVATAAPVAASVAVNRKPAVEEAGVAVAEAAEGLVQNASQRLKGLPWQTLLGLAAGAIVLSVGLMLGLQRWQSRASASTSAVEAATDPASPLKAVPAKAGDAAAGQALSATAEAPVAATTPLVLRARRPCWLVLEVDGQRLPTVTLNEGDKRSWSVSQRAVLLAGNVGALRVWWRGDNLGYLGELSARQNGLVFEPGKAFRVDHGHDLPLPAGVPE